MMFKFHLFSAIFASSCIATSVLAQVPDGAFWAVYNATADTADEACLVEVGESVPDSCCTGAGSLTPHGPLQGEDTCFVLGPGLIPFSGCVGDGVAGYGENCEGEGAPFVAANAEECGCSFVIEGSGCFKANDLSGQQWFVYLDGDACAEDPPVEIPDGAFWAVYNATADTADEACLVEVGESVPDSCCTGAGSLTPHGPLQGEDTCFVLGPGLIPFSGCVRDGVAGYGENCEGEGAPFVAANAEECGCSFVIEGSGCFKANDLPGQQWFVYLDGDACAEDPPVEIPDGAFWAVYNATADTADEACLVEVGESVPDSCCTGAGSLTPHGPLQGEDTCFVLGPGLIPFSGCVGDGVAGYGENCEGEGAPFVAANAEECGCSFVIEGSGCFKANDLPGQQWFVYLDGDACAEDPPVEIPDGAFWAVYNATADTADEACLVEVGESVPDSCCTGAGSLTPHGPLQGEDTCFVLGPGLIPFSGCVGDGVAGYGENCEGEGAPFVAANAEECGCSFVIEGSGCFKANDLPGQQWFVYLDGDACAEDPPVEIPDGAFWAVYNATADTADEACLVEVGESVPDSCCTGAGSLTPHGPLQGEDTCFVLGPGLIPFSGCVGDGVAGYGENCEGEGAPFVAANAEECGCSFVIEGSGCFKANDLPGQQWFVYLDGDACAEDPVMTEAPTVGPAETEAPTNPPELPMETEAPSVPLEPTSGAPVFYAFGFMFFGGFVLIVF